MIKLNNVNKYFNRHKKNEIHVINNTTLELDDKGLVALLGPSGCGKTTLLNVIGGLDKVNSGVITLEDEKITRRSVRKIDEIRSLKIGYIFQDYNLINNKSVYDNIAMVLMMNGIKDKKEIEKRVNYVLEKVGMYRYRNRYASMLSGGERQRVGIARAIVKNPSIIIADEPTGNLDSKNTIEVMNIIKAISKDRLVILVTHEKDLAEFYASRIITLRDGTIISDKENIHDNDLDYKMDGKIYLKDIKEKINIKEKNLNINYYNDDNTKLNINLVVKNGNIYIETDNKKKIEVIGEESAIELVDDHYKKISRNIYEDYKFDFNEIIDKNIKLKYKSIYNIITLLKEGFKKVFNYGIIKKLLLLGFFASSMFIVFAVSSIMALVFIKDEDFIKYNKNYSIIKDNNISLEEYNSYSSYEDSFYILPGDSMINMTLPFDNYYQTLGSYGTLTGSLSSINMITEKDIINGNIAKNETEIVVDKKVIEKLLQNTDALQTGFTNLEKFIGKKVNISEIKEYRISGIVDLGSPSIYTFENEHITIINNSSVDSNDFYYESPTNNEKIQNYKLIEKEITLTKGSFPVNDYEVLINENLKDTYKIGSDLDLKIAGKTLKVVGYYHSDIDLNDYLVTESTVKYNLITTNSDLIVYSKDKNKTIEYYRNLGVNIQDTYKQAKDDYIESMKKSTVSKLIFSGVILGISLIEIYLMIRSSFLSRIKEVGILRAIGLKKLDIYKMFSGEILAISILASTPGLLLMSYILKQLSGVSFLSKVVIMNPLVFIISLLLILGFNLIFGLLPVFTTLRKTPAGILSRTDLE